jgi:hypothetical protein
MASGAIDGSIPRDIVEAAELNSLLNSGIVVLNMKDLNELPAQVVADLQMIRTIERQVRAAKQELRR